MSRATRRNSQLGAVDLSVTYARTVMIDPRNHGAVGDFSTDDTAALQASIDEAFAAGGGTVQLQANKTYTSQSLILKTAVTIAGVGPYSRIFHKPGATTPLFSLYDNATTDVTIRDLQINGSVASQTNAVDAIYLDHTGGNPLLLPKHRILNVEIRSVKGNGLNLGNYTRGTIVDGLSVYAADGYGVVLGGADSLVSNVDSASSGLDGFYISGGAYVISNTKSWNSGRINGVGSGYNIMGQTVVLHGAHAQENKGNGFTVFKSGTVINGLVMTGCVADSDNVSAGGYAAISLYNVANAVIHGCVKTFAGGAGTPVNGVSIGGGSNGCDIRLAVSGQSSWAVTGADIGSNTVQINGRQDRIYAPAFASTLTPNPWTARTFSQTLTGNLTIANPGVKPAGVNLRFILTQDGTGGRTVTWGTDFLTTGSVDTRASKVSVIDFVCDGTSWNQTNTPGSITRSINSISSPATAGAGDFTDYVYLVSGTTTLTLPTAVGNANKYAVKNSGSNTVTIATTSSQTIDGSSTATLPVANTSLDLISDGANWKVI
jgi:hypothetical protein